MDIIKQWIVVPIALGVMLLYKYIAGRNDKNSLKWLMVLLSLVLVVGAITVLFFWGFGAGGFGTVLYSALIKKIIKIWITYPSVIFNFCVQNLVISLVFIDYSNEQLIKNRRLWQLAEYERQRLILYTLQSFLMMLFLKSLNFVQPVFILAVAPVIALSLMYVYIPKKNIKKIEPKIYPEQQLENSTTTVSIQNDRLCIKKIVNYEYEHEFIIPEILERNLKMFGDSVIHIKRLDNRADKAVFKFTKIEYNKKFYEVELCTDKDVTLGELEYCDWIKYFGLDNIKVTRDDGLVSSLEIINILTGLKVLPKFLGNEFIDPMTLALGVIKVFDIYGNSMKWLNQHKITKDVFELVINPVISKNSVVLTQQFLDKLIMLIAKKKVSNPEEVIANYKDMLQFACEKKCAHDLHKQIQLINKVLEEIQQKGFEYYITKST